MPTLAPVGPGELDEVFTVLDDAASWLVERGIDQWPDSFQPDGWRAEALRRHASVGEVWLLREGGQPSATMTVTTWADLDFAHGWPGGAADARYVARLATARHASGRGVGAWMLDQAARMAAEAGCRWLRLDCAKHNPGLHAYYERHGFEHVCTVDLDFRRSGALFQRPAVAGG